MRKDGRRLKHTNPMYTVAAHIMSERSDAMNMIELNIPVVPMQNYLGAKRKDGKSISHLALVIAAYVRTVAEVPALNRFIVNKKIYARNELAIGMVVLKPGETDGTMNKMYFDPEDDIFTVNEKINTYIEQNREVGDTNKTDDIIKTLLGIPGLLNIGVKLFKLMDRYGWLPRKLIEASPFHVSMTITNLASIKTNHIYHHVYNFGTTSMIVSMGNLREVPRRSTGEIVFDRCLPLGVVMDERIASGSYFAKAFITMKNYLADPTLLEGAPRVCIREWEDKTI